MRKADGATAAARESAPSAAHAAAGRAGGYLAQRDLQFKSGEELGGNLPTHDQWIERVGILQMDMLSRRTHGPGQWAHRKRSDNLDQRLFERRRSRTLCPSLYGPNLDLRNQYGLRNLDA